MSLLHLKFVPVLEFWTDLAQGFKLQGQYPTTDNDMDDVLQENLTSDTIKFQDAVQNEQWQVYQYTFDPIESRIHLWVRNPSGGDMSPVALKSALESYRLLADSIVGANQMDRSKVIIVNGDTAQAWGYQRIDLLPKISEVQLIIPTGTKGEYDEHKVDLSRL